MVKDEVRDLKEFLSETVRNARNFVHSSRGGPNFKWTTIKAKDYQIFRGLLSENLHYSKGLHRFMAKIDNLEEYIKKDNKIETDKNRLQDSKLKINANSHDMKGEEGIHKKNPFLKIENAINYLTLDVMAICYVIIIYSLIHIFMRTEYMNPLDNWILFLYSVLVIVILTVIRSDVYYCVCGRGKTRDLIFCVKYFAFLLIMDLAFIMRIVFVLMPSYGLSFGKLLLLIFSLYRYGLQLLVYLVINTAKCKTREYKSKLANRLMQKYQQKSKDNIS